MGEQRNEEAVVIPAWLVEAVIQAGGITIRLGAGGEAAPSRVADLRALEQEIGYRFSGRLDALEVRLESFAQALARRGELTEVREQLEKRLDLWVDQHLHDLATLRAEVEPLKPCGHPLPEMNGRPCVCPRGEAKQHCPRVECPWKVVASPPAAGGG